MTVETALPISKIVGTKLTNGGKVALIAFESGRSILKLAFPRESLTRLAIVALRAKTLCEPTKSKENPWLPEALDTLLCDRWEVHKAGDGNKALLCFRIVGGAWIRITLPLQIATSLHEALGTLTKTTAIQSGITLN